MIDVTWSTPEISAQQSVAQQPPRYQQDRQVVGAHCRNSQAEIARPAPLLMSAENPTGLKLEELLARVRAELAAKNAKLAAGGEFGVDPASTQRMLTRTIVRELNERLITLLVQASLVQADIQHELSKLGADQGPTGQARV